MNRKVTYARFHQGLHLQGAGDIGTFLPMLTKNLKDLDMRLTDAYLLVNFTSPNGQKIESAVPSANVSIALLGPEEAPKPAAIIKSAAPAQKAVKAVS